MVKAGQKVFCARKNQGTSAPGAGETHKLRVGRRPPFRSVREKSFLVLFCKKEPLSSFPECIA
jgi:hypothetical protein